MKKSIVSLLLATLNFSICSTSITDTFLKKLFLDLPAGLGITYLTYEIFSLLMKENNSPENISHSNTEEDISFTSYLHDIFRLKKNNYTETTLLNIKNITFRIIIDKTWSRKNISMIRKLFIIGMLGLSSNLFERSIQALHIKDPHDESFAKKIVHILAQTTNITKKTHSFIRLGKPIGDFLEKKVLNHIKDFLQPKLALLINP